MPEKGTHAATKEASEGSVVSDGDDAAMVGSSSRKMGLMQGPATVIEHSYLLPPIGVRPRVSIEKRKPQKHESYPHVQPPGSLPIYGSGPLFQQSHLLRELTLPVQTGPVPNWVSVSFSSIVYHSVLPLRVAGPPFLWSVRLARPHLYRRRLAEPCPLRSVREVEANLWLRHPSSSFPGSPEPGFCWRGLSCE